MKVRDILTVFLFLIAGVVPCWSGTEMPFDKKGLQESGYQLSQYENISLADGNLHFRVPLYTLRTDGGLEYPVSARYNSKRWYAHRYCEKRAGNDGYVSCEGTVIGDFGGEFVSVEVAAGLSAYGFGWDIRLWRVQEMPIDDY